MAKYQIMYLRIYYQECNEMDGIWMPNLQPRLTSLCVYFPWVGLGFPCKSSSYRTLGPNIAQSGPSSITKEITVQCHFAGKGKGFEKRKKAHLIQLVVLNRNSKSEPVEEKPKQNGSPLCFNLSHRLFFLFCFRKTFIWFFKKDYSQ